MLGAAGYALRTGGIFACQAGSYTGDRYLSYCQALKYGDYDHGAIWFGLEPEANQAAASADVLFVGNSRTQFGFSSDATDRWFAGASARYYLLGFSHYENFNFEAPLLKKLSPRARVYIINMDSFFEPVVQPPAATVMHDPGAEGRYRQKQLAQSVHQAICGLVPLACGDEYTIFRNRPTGSWVVAGGTFREADVGYDPSVDSAKVASYVARGQEFLPTLKADRSCVILTIVPTVQTAWGSARAIAAGLGTPFVAPQPEGLRTFDAIHLDRPSAERWSAAFFAEAGPVIERCLASEAEVRP